MTASWDDEKLAALVGDGGDSGLALYGAYWRIAEIVAAQMDGPEPSCAVSYPVTRWAQKLFVRKSYATSILLRLQKEKLLVIEGDPKTDESVIVRMANLKKYRDEYSKKSGHAPDNVPPRTEGEAEGDKEAEVKPSLAPLAVPPQSSEEVPPVPTKPKTQKAAVKVAKDRTKTALAETRHAEFKAALKAYWESKNPGIEMPWDGAEGKQLGMWLKSSPTVSIEQFTGWLRNRFRSDVIHTERPSRWILNVTNFANGPVDRYNKPLTGGNSHASGKQHRSEEDLQRLRAITEQAVAAASRNSAVTR